MSNVSITYGLFDTTAKQDTTATSNTSSKIFNWIDLNDLKLEAVTPIKAATFEEDYWKLDGSFDMFPDEPENNVWGLWGNELSALDGTLANNLYLTLNFSNLHSSAGLTFEFNPYDNSYCSSLNVKWYNGNTLLDNKDFAPTKWRYFCNNVVQNYNKIVIQFKKLNKPNRYLKVQSIAHGQLKEFDNDSLIDANLLEEIDLTGATLTINTLDFTVFSKDNEFNIFNPQGIYELLQKNKKLRLRAKVNL